MHAATAKPRRRHELEREILMNAKTLAALHARMRESLAQRDNAETRATWAAACAEFHARYDALSFPGGYDSGLKRLERGDADAIEAAIIFLELRPYFFRSGYMRKRLKQRLKRCARLSMLSKQQLDRFDDLIQREKLWAATKA